MITIQGADEIIEMLEEMVDASKLNGAVDKACLFVEGEARRKAPRRTGNLRRSIESKVENNGDEIVVKQIKLETETGYDKWIDKRRPDVKLVKRYNE